MSQRKQNVQIQKNFPRNSKKSEYINENFEHFCINYWFQFQKIIWGLTSKRNSIILNPISIDMRKDVGTATRSFDLAQVHSGTGTQFQIKSLKLIVIVTINIENIKKIRKIKSKKYTNFPLYI